MSVIEEIEKKQEMLLKRLEERREERNGFRAEMSQRAARRDELNSKARELAEEAKHCREERDKLNANVKELKNEKEALVKKLSQLKKKYLPDKGPYLSTLEKELKQLEFKQMTTVLGPKKEKELVKNIGEVRSQINERREILERNKEVQSTLKKQTKVKDKLLKLVALAQEKHDRMVQLYTEADKLRKLADDSHRDFVAYKKKGDQSHSKYVKILSQVREFEKVISNLKARARREKKAGAEGVAKKMAEEIYKRLKSGEKLSTEDLLKLQKAGLI